MKELYDITRTRARKRRNPSKPVEDKEGITINKEAVQISRREKRFKEILNRDPPAENPDIPIAEMLLSIKTNQPSKAEISRAPNMLKDGKTPGPRILLDRLKGALDENIREEHHLFVVCDNRQMSSAKPRSSN